jgi:hypothetical protein
MDIADLGRRAVESINVAVLVFEETPGQAERSLLDAMASIQAALDQVRQVEPTPRPRVTRTGRVVRRGGRVAVEE